MHSVLTYIFFGYALAVAGIDFVAVDYLWKDRFFNKLLIASLVSAILGLALETTSTLEQPVGVTFIIMAYPSAFLGYFQALRWIFKRIRHTEPVMTSRTSVIGDGPLDAYTSAGKDGRRRKFEKGRRITAWDFLFTFTLVLPPIFVVMALLAVLNRR